MLALIKTHLKENTFFWISVLGTFLIYIPTLSYPPISWDDPEMIFKNKDVIDFNLIGFFKNHYVGNYIPVTMLFHGVSYLLFKNSILGYHVLGIVFHLLNGFLLYQLSLKLFKENKKLSALTAAIFLLHPIQIESIVWVSEFKTLLFSFFSLLSINYYLNQEEDKRAIYKSFLFFVLACLSKPAAVILPLILLAIDYFKSVPFKKSLLSKLPWLLASLLFGVINIQTQTSDQFINFSHAFPFHERIINAGYAILMYLKLFLFPYPQSIIYPFPEKTILLQVIGLIGILGLLASFFLLYKKSQKKILFVLSFFLINLILVIQLIPFGEVLYADRYMYFALIGTAWLLGLTITKFEKLFIPVFALVVLACLLFTYNRNQKWESSITLYKDIIEKYPKNFLALNSLGVEYMMKDNSDQALYYLNQATDFAPFNYKGFYNKSLVYLKSNNPGKAIENLNKVLSMYDYEKAYIARASAYYSLGKHEEAQADAKTALIKNRFNDKAYFIIGNCANDKNNLEQAISYYEKAIELDNRNPDYHFKLAITYGKKQDFTKCIDLLNKTLQLKPNYYEAYYWRGVAKVNLKENPCEDFKKAAENGFSPAVEAIGKYCN
ncbi:MAG: tetratricopeptide repeat protein [Bacteroidia bacterium]